MANAEPITKCSKCKKNLIKGEIIYRVVKHNNFHYPEKITNIAKFDEECWYKLISHYSDNTEEGQ